MKHIMTLLVTSLATTVAIAAPSSDVMSYRCFGKSTDFAFQWNITYNHGTLFKSQLIKTFPGNDVRRGEWKSVSSTKFKFEVESPWSQYRTYMYRNRQVKLGLAVVDPTTSVELDNPPYTEFKCYKH
ncbi:hypothetical protein [Bdellovibrio sp. HCB209]|uniref:hypothetical protein n=1 Tax=Bdellovibrio sp. HCB209 TaxID=3394354 RepID=UPI0039B612D3